MGAIGGGLFTAGRGVAAADGRSLLSGAGNAARSFGSVVQTAGGGARSAVSGYLSQVSWGTLGKATIANAGVGGLGNVATYAVTPGNDHSVLGFATAFGTGAISGAGVGAAAPLAAPIGGLLPRTFAQVGVGGGSSVLAGKIENGEDYSFVDGLWDLGMGSGMSYLRLRRIFPTRRPAWPTTSASRQRPRWQIGAVTV